jgi:hypothetical protein
MKTTHTLKKYCKQPLTKQRTFDPGISQHRMSFILSTGLKWVNGTEIKYMFIEGPEPQKKML